jgi:hypothetical protein
MRMRLLLAAGFLLLAAACQKPEGRVKVLIGATTTIAPGRQPIPDSIIVIAGARIRSVGLRKDTPVPQASDRTDLSGKWVVPAAGARIEPDDSADLLVLDHEPKGITPASPGDVGARLVAGEWQAAH